MSAIWGIISRNEADLQNKFDKMTETMKQYKIDRTDTAKNSSSYVGCGHQYFTPEDENDISPIFDETENTLFVADCFLYNRDKLIAAISSISENAASMGDAQLAFYAYKKYGFAFVEHLRGSFAIAIYKTATNELHLFTDHFCKRYLAFTVADSFIAFGSTYKPILAALDNKPKISKHFVVNAYSTMSPLNFLNDELTPFEGISHLDAARHFTINISTGEVKKEQYWQPIKTIRKNKGLSDNEYKEKFLKLYEEVCVAHLRSRTETGIMLSGGLDSSSVLAMVAPELRKRGKNIYSYTSVPSSTFKAKINYNVIEDESFLIWEQKKYQENLVPRFIGGEDDNCLDFVPKYQEILDLPIKAAINNYNIIKMGDAAVADNCSILLGGGNGNANVSYGYTSNYVGLCLSTFKPVSAIKEAGKYCKRCNISRKKFFKDFIKDIKNYYFQTQNIGQYFVSAENRKTYDIDKKIKKNKRSLGSAFVTNELQKRNFMFIPNQYIQKSLYYTCLSLEKHYLQLDPTLTVELVEFCMSLPNECFVKDGVERRLVRDYMKELLPPFITDMRKGYGVQASDFNHRINRDWDRLKDEVMDLLNDKALDEYLDRKEIDELIDNIKGSEKNLAWNTAWFMVSICALGYFLRGHKEYL